MSGDATLSFARELYKQQIRVDWQDGDGDAYVFCVEDDGALRVRTASARGVLYAVYDALDGQPQGEARPEFAIRGLNPCESLNRHSPTQLARLIDRMGRWRMNTLIIHSNYGFEQHRSLIEREAALRGIELVHYTYSNLCFMDGIDPEHFARGADGQPMWERAECETRLCVSDSTGLERYTANIAQYIEAHPDFERMIFCTADGASLCQCPHGRERNAISQWRDIFNPFFDIAHRQRKLEMLVYIQRFSVPSDLSRISRLDRVLFDTHLRYPRTALGTSHAWGKHGPRSYYPADIDPLQDPRGDQPINVYLWDRLVEWRRAFQGQLYVFENLMIQGIWGCPRPNTSIYLEDLRNFKKLGIDGVVYEAFEPGIEPFVPTFNAIALAMWNLNYPYQPTLFEQAYLASDAADEEFGYHWVGHPHWDAFRGDYSRNELAKLLYEHNRMRSLEPSEENIKQATACCRCILDYLLSSQCRESFDWLYITFNTLRRLHQLGALAPANNRELAFLESVKLWDFQERYAPSRQVAAEVIYGLQNRLEANQATFTA